ncbi:MAG: phosphorylase [Flavobacteriaceae bacterium]|nr:phosphorylase [Flavobacteriaceae bacterium]
MVIQETELILNSDGSIYHLKLKPGEVGETILLVGDPERVPEVSKHFDKVELTRHCRELLTHSGYIGSKKVTCISTGMGTDNIDIVLNELDALFNVDFETRKIKSNLTKLNIIRLGTSGSLQESIPVDSILVSNFALGLDALMQYYEHTFEDKNTKECLDKFAKKMQLPLPYFVACSNELLGLFPELLEGVTATCPGFYAPQGRQIRASTNQSSSELVQELNQLKITVGNKMLNVTNFEMETAGIYGLARVLGHEALSVNAILANRITNNFSQNPSATIERMIQVVFDKLFG